MTRFVRPLILLVTTTGVALASEPPPVAPDAAAEDDVPALEGGEEGTVFKSLTVTGEDRIRLEFDRPELRLDLDPRTAPGLEWGEPMDILAEPGVDLRAPLVSQSTADPGRFRGAPWLATYRTGPVARFRPQMEDVSHWWLTLADSRSDTLRTFEGKGNPPDEIVWDGRARDGSYVPPGITCSYVLEATDRAGNRRSFVGEGFGLPPYRVRTEESEILLFAGSELGNIDAMAGATVAPSIVRETASWLNQIEPSSGPVEVRVTARSFDEAKRCGSTLLAALQPLVTGDPARIRTTADVRPDAPTGGTVAVKADLTAAR